MTPVLTTLRFSPRPNRAGEIRWHEWGPAAFRAAEERDLPILLHLTAPWCHWCHVVDETTLSDPEVIALLNDSLLPLRVDTDRHPHVRDRYIAGGWPTTAFLTPDGEVLWSGTGLEAHELLHVARGVLRGWRDRRDELRGEVERRRMAIQASGRRHAASGLVRRESADSVLSALIDSADARNGGFGDAPRFPSPDAVELLFAEGLGRGDPQCAALAERHLDGILAGELFDRVDGGFFRYALQPDWTEPQYEKLLAVNGGLLRAFALGAVLTGRSDWEEAAETTVEWVQSRLLRKDGLWGASQDADPDYYALRAADRRGRAAPNIDATAYVDANATWISGLASAGGRLGRAEWIRRAEEALHVLDTGSRDPAGRVAHFVGDDPLAPTDLLVDLVGLARACLAVAQATGGSRWVDRAREIVARMQERLADDDGGFRDLPQGAELLGALRYRDRPFDLNADAARLLIDLTTATGDRSYRAMAERVLALLSPSAPRYGAAAAGFALAMGEFFDPPLGFYVVGSADATSAMRAAAFARPEPGLRVWTVEPGAGSLNLPTEPVPSAYAFRGSSRSRAVTDPADLGAAADSIR